MSDLKAAPDVVAELDEWLAAMCRYNPGHTPTEEEQLVQRARDEIVALRKAHLHGWEIDRIAHEARAEALEEAAGVAQSACQHANWPNLGRDIAAAIRGLK